MQKKYKNLIVFLSFVAFFNVGGFLRAETTLPLVNTNTNATAPVVDVVIVVDKFIVPLNVTQEQIVQSLFDQNFIKDKNNFLLIFNKTKGDILPGAYKINTNMTATSVAKVLHGKPYMKWVVIPPGLRKEEIAEILATNLSWTKIQKSSWINKYTKMKFDYTEGVYFPDTYLIPISESPLQVANRLIAKFNEKFSPYILNFKNQNMLWTKGLTLASVVQREAANDADMPLIAGILLNRLNQKIPLSVDATLQYARGDKGKGWWAPITVADKKIVSAYNTYKNAGLPPHPISNPGLPAILAVINPTKTDCIYYLHDKDKVTHCAVTYAEHQANIIKYLK
ncbi:MAG: endolytic transglycosylase MltG [bacterium]